MGIFNIFKSKPGTTQADQPVAQPAAQNNQATTPTAGGTTQSIAQTKEQSDYDKLMAFERKIGAPYSGGATINATTESQQKKQEDLALKVRNPFRGA
ncbi:MAG: hypothetical protein QY318_02500 [Candidatus Dojkabacteria bacterium]|nr:MAG: hypothetical protein QY318_02500 [Candidatus Dojkabacteria bacterium]